MSYIDNMDNKIDTILLSVMGESVAVYFYLFVYDFYQMSSKRCVYRVYLSENPRVPLVVFILLSVHFQYKQYV